MTDHAVAIAAQRQHDAALIRTNGSAMIDAMRALRKTLEQQRDVQATRNSASAVFSFDNAIEKLGAIEAETQDMLIELVAAFYHRDR